MRPQARLTVRLTPRSGRDHVEGVRDGLLLVRVAAPPVDGAANEALLRLLGSELGLPRSSLRLVAGRTGRQKVVAIDAEGAAEAVRTCWPGVAVG
jgi:uncharacterized protein YggU (UPF0235/DUF167 family)